ncbi:hypothetical protein AA0117_g7221 [Alternaria alternata]|uniref:Rhodopsin domain-containing protein n=1 Tax=Alternaria alternata TaxID=5599 RepID=A0A4Q4NCN0_ALTAL|nr:hypothetical protein AA0117_g7221 [Alternaria alternata]
MMKWNYANSIIYNPILALVKASFLMTLIKLRSQNKWINVCLWGTLIINGCFAVAAPLACILQCNPISKYWNPGIQGRCVDAGAYTVSTSLIVLTTDVLILLMPSWILHDLKMPLGRKLMVIAFLSFGILVTVVGAVRTSVLVKVFVLKEATEDGSYGVGYTLSNIESGLAIVGTCGPTIKYFLSCCIPSLSNADESSNRGYMYPTAGSQGDARSKRFTRTAKTHSTFKEIDELELTNVPGEDKHITRRDTQRGDPMMITKTVAWTVDNSHEKDSNSTNGEQRPRDLL